ncbi:MAG: Tim44 domain-containing protein [Alphaproteobacteria bacterium]|uniref:Tim44 domain-containing protein n=1 Tax=Candidatus Nitrobium versatile TaxID=2884831 RepID=A0A953LV89_9BACT|nr:Tim44 domain-containing protein [Candidatus Nitrobium versatile]
MKVKKVLLVLAIFTFFAVYLEESAFARAGRSGGSGGSSLGSRGSRTYSAPSRPAPSQNTYQNQQSSALPQQPAAPQSGGFLRNMAGGLAGGFLGAMLFRSLGFGGGMGGMGGGGIGLIEILLIAGIGFVIYKMVRSRRQAAPAYGGYQGRQQDYSGNYQPPRDITRDTIPVAPSRNDAAAGLAHIRAYDSSFDEGRFREKATDIFFKVQAAWMNRDLESSRQLFARDIYDTLHADLSRMKAEGRINRLENIAMRGVEITEAWQEQGKDFVTVAITANVLDYETDESGRLLEGSKTEPVKFMEYWTFVKPSGSGTGTWQLSAIQQAELEN